tara:strand:+ start:1272 stop:2081 length:810 start_codon:yes stop_codon:yes gene_type:complete
MSGGMGGNDAGVDPPTSVKGDISGFDTTFARIPVGVDGQVVTADSTEALGLKWAAPASSIPATKMNISTDFSNSARFATALIGTGEAIFGNNGVRIGLGADVSSSSDCMFSANGTSSFDIFAGNPSFSACISCDNIGSNSGAFYIGLSNLIVSASSIGFTRQHYGFKILTVSGVNTLYATQADGTTETVSAALTTVTSNKSLDLIIDVTTDTSATYYWRLNGASLSAGTTLTTNNPAGTTSKNRIQVCASNLDTISQQQFDVTSVAYAR